MANSVQSYSVFQCPDGSNHWGAERSLNFLDTDKGKEESNASHPVSSELSQF